MSESCLLPELDFGGEAPDVGRYGRANDRVEDPAHRIARHHQQQLVPSGQISSHSGTHLDFQVSDVAAAARQIDEIGGVLVSPPDFYAPDGEALLEWAVMRDPFGNDFCIIKYPLD